jgi:MoaA/NifB/PqqE/SkfB family radical SAM enzyme
VRVTVQRANYRQMSALVVLARQLGAAQISFLAADVSNRHAFGRGPGGAADVALQPDDLPVLERVLAALEREHADDFGAAFIAERPRKLRHILEYYRALLGLGDNPPIRCNAPEFSAVVTPDGRIDPCFFIRGPARDPSLPLDAALNDPVLATLRADVRGNRRPECRMCVCSLWREPDDRAARAVAVFRPY